MKPTKGIFCISCIAGPGGADVDIKVPIFVLVVFPESIRRPKDVLIGAAQCREIKSLLVTDEVL